MRTLLRETGHSDIASYLRSMADEETWGTDIEMGVIVRLFRCDTTVYRLEEEGRFFGQYRHFTVPSSAPALDTAPKICLLLANDHYDLLVPCQPDMEADFVIQDGRLVPVSERAPSTFHGRLLYSDVASIGIRQTTPVTSDIVKGDSGEHLFWLQRHEHDSERRGDLCFRDHYQPLGTVANVRGETEAQSRGQLENSGCFEKLRRSVPCWFPERLKNSPALISCSVCREDDLLERGGFYTCGGECDGQGCRDSSVVFCRDCYAKVMLQTPRKFRSLVPLAYLARRRAVRLLLAGEFVKYVDAGGGIERRQDLEESHPELFLEHPNNLLAEDASPTRNIFVVSYPWLSKEHPDPDGHTSRAVADFLKEDGRRPAYLFWDFCSLEEPNYNGLEHMSREEHRSFMEQTRRYDLAMSAYETLFAGQSPRLCVLRVTSVPKDAADNRPFYSRGWCQLESALAAHKRPEQVRKNKINA
uniref:OTU domain-containing protein n=1 Tax=Chromera velia CCMP2878 TaxID=1169474 RepID=A0A0K6SAI2_9ALVE|eukprot:Cvel_1575.t2-p1 / transcript=Cvel_1575.t2 / gene=Cvel_1575 / organism=Chromera_velia_CCMP2878 / gene_product=hypothetical protein / transcript_product=hypothetical protein / location=Cvel_scaffold56:45924-50277(+) / protein_length=471 / sequence_SO=supercontig / SO=protein_coding / is_pseudo=false